MKYLILREQGGEGCDYTIGCGKNWSFVEFDGDVESCAKYYSDEEMFGEEEDREVEETLTRTVSLDYCASEITIIPIDVTLTVDIADLAKKHNAIIKTKKDIEKNEAMLKLSPSERAALGLI